MSIANDRNFEMSLKPFAFYANFVRDCLQICLSALCDSLKLPRTTKQKLEPEVHMASEARAIVLLGLENAGHRICWRLARQHVPAGRVLRREGHPASPRPRNDAPLEADFRRQAASRATSRQQVDHLLRAQFLRVQHQLMSFFMLEAGVPQCNTM